MKNQNVNHADILNALFEDKNFSKEHLGKAKESIRKGKINKKEFMNIQAYHSRLNERRTELILKILESNKFTEDLESKELIDTLKKTLC